MSRKRKKKSKASRPARVVRTQLPESERSSGRAAQDNRELAQAFQNLMAYRDEIDTRRKSRTAEMATILVADLLLAIAEQPGIVVTDALCQRMGATLADDRESPFDVGTTPTA